MSSQGIHSSLKSLVLLSKEDWTNPSIAGLLTAPDANTNDMLILEKKIKCATLCFSTLVLHSFTINMYYLPKVRGVMLFRFIIFFITCKRKNCMEKNPPGAKQNFAKTSSKYYTVSRNSIHEYRTKIQKIIIFHYFCQKSLSKPSTL